MCGILCFNDEARVIVGLFIGNTGSLIGIVSSHIFIYLHQVLHFDNQVFIFKRVGKGYEYGIDLSV